MTDNNQPEWNQQQRDRLKTFGIGRSVDIHCHCLPGLDDGPRDLSQAIALCAALAEDGLTTVMATPHQLGRYERLHSASMIQEEIDQLAEALVAEKVALEILPGGDVRIDERLPQLLDRGEVVTLGGSGRHLLLELPHEMYIDPLPTIRMLQERGIQTIMTHPERHPYLASKEGMLKTWLSEGAVIQVTAGSLLGDFGRRAYQQAWTLMQSGFVSLVATDAHDIRQRPPRLSAALELLSERVGSRVARTLCLDNPELVYRGVTIKTPLSSVTD